MQSMLLAHVRSGLEKRPMRLILDALVRDDAVALTRLWENDHCSMQTLMLDAVRHRAKGCIDAIMATGTCSINTLVCSAKWAGKRNALIMALCNDDGEMARWLYTRHEARCHNPIDASTWGQARKMLQVMIINDCSTSVRFLLGHRVPGEPRLDCQLALVTAARYRHAIGFIPLLLQAKAEINKSPHETLSAALFNRGALASLVRAKIDTNATAEHTGNTALHELLNLNYLTKRDIIRRGVLSVLKLLLEAKASPYTRNHAGLLPVQLLQCQEDVPAKHEMEQLLLDP
jgi:hypothetical protein